MFGDNLEELRESLISLKNKLLNVNQEINKSKTVWLTFGNVEDEDDELYLGRRVDSNKIQKVESFKYLGIHIENKKGIN